MMRNRPWIVAVVALLLGLLLGSAVAPASAAGLTSKAVRRIAAAVVTQTAPSLTVARAGDADTVGGLTAGQLGTKVFQYTVTGPSGVQQTGPGGPYPPPSRPVDFPNLPAGKYVVGYAVTLQFSDPATAGGSCLFAFSSGNVYGDTEVALGAPRSDGTVLGGCSGTVALTVPQSSGLLFSAVSAGSPFTVYPGLSTVTFTRVDQIVERTTS